MELTIRGESFEEEVEECLYDAYTADVLTEITEMCNEREPRAVTEIELDDDGELRMVWEDAEA